MADPAFSADPSCNPFNAHNPWSAFDAALSDELSSSSSSHSSHSSDPIMPPPAVLPQPALKKKKRPPQSVVKRSDPPPPYEPITLSYNPSTPEKPAAPVSDKPQDQSNQPVSALSLSHPPLSRSRSRLCLQPLHKLDRIDELDETNPLGLSLHHNGPYDEVRSNGNSKRIRPPGLDSSDKSSIDADAQITSVRSGSEIQSPAQKHRASRPKKSSKSSRSSSSKESSNGSAGQFGPSLNLVPGQIIPRGLLENFQAQAAGLSSFNSADYYPSHPPSHDNLSNYDPRQLRQQTLAQLNTSDASIPTSLQSWSTQSSSSSSSSSIPETPIKHRSSRFDQIRREVSLDTESFSSSSSSSLLHSPTASQFSVSSQSSHSSRDSHHHRNQVPPRHRDRHNHSTPSRNLAPRHAAEQMRQQQFGGQHAAMPLPQLLTQSSPSLESILVPTTPIVDIRHLPPALDQPPLPRMDQSLHSLQSPAEVLSPLPIKSSNAPRVASQAIFLDPTLHSLENLSLADKANSAWPPVIPGDQHFPPLSAPNVGFMGQQVDQLHMDSSLGPMPYSSTRVDAGSPFLRVESLVPHSSQDFGPIGTRPQHPQQPIRMESPLSHPDLRRNSSMTTLQSNMANEHHLARMSSFGPPQGPGIRESSIFSGIGPSDVTALDPNMDPRLGGIYPPRHQPSPVSASTRLNNRNDIERAIGVIGNTRDPDDASCMTGMSNSSQRTDRPPPHYLPKRLVMPSPLQHYQEQQQQQHPTSPYSPHGPRADVYRDFDPRSLQGGTPSPLHVHSGSPQPLAPRAQHISMPSEHQARKVLKKRASVIAPPSGHDSQFLMPAMMNEGPPHHLKHSSFDPFASRSPEPSKDKPRRLSKRKSEL